MFHPAGQNGPFVQWVKRALRTASGLLAWLLGTLLKAAICLKFDRDPVRHADEAYVAARARRLDRLHHRLLRTNTFQHRVCAEAPSWFLDARNTFIASLSHDVSGTKFACQLLPDA